MSSVHAAELVFLLLLLFVVVFGTLARKLNTPYPIVMVGGGPLLSFIPGIPRITLNPDLRLSRDPSPTALQRGWVGRFILRHVDDGRGPYFRIRKRLLESLHADTS
jgi:hypothetical protein